MKTFRFFHLALVFLIPFSGVFAQETTIKGKVKDGDTGEGMPFVHVYFQGTSEGTTTDFDGLYNLRSSNPKADSVSFTFLGYDTKVVAFNKGQQNTINVNLSAGATVLDDVIVTDKKWENPAWEILRKVVEAKNDNDKRSLEAFEYDSYAKVEIDVDNITEKFKEKRVVRKILNALDSAQKIAGEDGKPILPVFISETLSHSYFHSNPEKRRENILKTQVQGIGISDNATMAQILGTSFQEYNFYNNWLTIVGKDFVSPIADSWKLFYEYELAYGKVLVEGDSCYRIDYYPKRPEDLAFSGTMWITSEHYALKQIDATINKEANLNFIEKIKLQQLNAKTDAGPWIPQKTRVLFDVGEIRDDWAGMLAKFYVSNKNFIVNQPRPLRFFEETIVVDELATAKADKAFWDAQRHEPMTGTELQMYNMIDTIKNLPVVKTYVEIIDIAVSGFKDLGKIEVGPYSRLYSFNDIEGHRFRVGFKTNEKFHPKWFFSGYGAYGTDDENWKYGFTTQYIINSKGWKEVGFSISEDIEQVSIYNDDVENTLLFQVSNRFGTLRQPFKNTLRKVWFGSDILPGFRFNTKFRNRVFNPLYNFRYQHPTETDVERSTFTVSEFVGELRYAPGEKYLYDENFRISLGTKGKPIFTFRYIYGANNVFGSNLEYQKFFGQIDHTMRVGPAGRFTYVLEGGYIPSDLPYPLLENHLGNNAFFFNGNSYNMMRLNEFVSDTYGSLRMIHRFDGFILNRIPLMRKLKWRLLATGNILYGSLRQDNRDLVLESIERDGTDIEPKSLSDAPYLEFGYGVENIFKFIRVDFLHRINYLDNVDAQPFGIRFSAQFRL